MPPPLLSAIPARLSGRSCSYCAGAGCAVCIGVGTWLPATLGLSIPICGPAASPPSPQPLAGQACYQAPAALLPPSAPDPSLAVTKPHMPFPARWFAPPFGAAELVNSCSHGSQPVNGHRLCKHRHRHSANAKFHLPFLTSRAPLPGRHQQPLKSPSGPPPAPLEHLSTLEGACQAPPRWSAASGWKS